MTIDLIDKYQELRHTVKVRKANLQELVDTDSGSVLRRRSIQLREEELVRAETQFDKFKYVFDEELDEIQTGVASRYWDYVD